jgi:hypothetical protein
MHTISVTLPSATYRRLKEQAQRVGKEPERLMRELLEPGRRAPTQRHFAGTARSQAMSDYYLDASA